VSGSDCDGQQLRCPNLFGDGFTVSPQAGDVNFDRLDGPLTAFFDRLAGRYLVIIARSVW
jgi:hypothetical protein